MLIHTQRKAMWEQILDCHSTAPKSWAQLVFNTRNCQKEGFRRKGQAQPCKRIDQYPLSVEIPKSNTRKHRRLVAKFSWKAKQLLIPRIITEESSLKIVCRLQEARAKVAATSDLGRGLTSIKQPSKTRQQETKNWTPRIAWRIFSNSPATIIPKDQRQN